MNNKWISIVFILIVILYVISFGPLIYLRNSIRPSNPYGVSASGKFINTMLYPHFVVVAYSKLYYRYFNYWNTINMSSDMIPATQDDIKRYDL